MRLIYNGKLPSANDLVQLNRVNRYAGAGLKKKYTDSVAAAFRPQACGKRFKGHCLVSVRFFEATNRRDDDNTISGLKYLLDGIVRAGIMPDDSKKYCHIASVECFESDLIINGRKQDYVEVSITEDEKSTTKAKNHKNASKMRS